MLQKSSIEVVAKSFVDDVATLCLQVLISRAVLLEITGRAQSHFICNAAKLLCKSSSWHCLIEPKTVASLIACIKNDDLAEDLMNLYPRSDRLVASGGT
jgi:acetone carboxylase gamma subunit